MVNSGDGFLEKMQSKNSRLEVLDCVASDSLKVEILGYQGLTGIKNPQIAEAIYYANQTGMQLKQIKITLDAGEVQIEAGSLQYMHGHIQGETKVGGVAGFGKAMLNKFLVNESVFIPRYRGTGSIYLEPSFSHFLVYYLNNEEIIADKGLFYCADGALEVGVAIQKNVSSALFGGEGLFQSKVKGTGICVFELPVPVEEVRCIHLDNETLSVDGNFALMRTGRIEFSVEKSAKNVFGTFTSGEMLLQTFRGTGKVWLAPTQGIYQALDAGGIGNLGVAPKSSNTQT